MRGVQNIKLNKGWLCNTLILVKGGVKYRNRNLQNLIIIYIAFPVSLVTTTTTTIIKTIYIIIRVTFPESFSLENFQC